MSEQHTSQKGAQATPEASSSKSGKIFGLDQFALMEIGLFFLVTLTLDTLLFDGDRYWRANPHPFWIIVLLVSVQYGLREGVVAAVSATIALLLFNVPEFSGQSWLDHLYTVSYHPLMWLATSIFVGILWARHIRKQQSLHRVIDEVEVKLTHITEAYNALDAQKTRLENLVSGQLSTAIEFYQTARSVELHAPGKTITSALSLVRTILDPSKVSIYLLVNDMLQAGVHEGWKESDGYITFFRSESPLFKAIVARKQFLNATNLEDEQILLGQGVLAGPLIDRSTGEVSGMLKIEKLGFLNFNLSGIKNFELLCEWIGSVLAGNKPRADDLATPGVGLQSSRLYEQHLGFLRSLSNRLHFDVSLVRIRLINPQNMEVEALQLTAAAVGRVVKQALRLTDYAFDYRRGWSYLILLPGTNHEQASTVADKLREGLDVALGRIAGAEFIIEVETID